MLVETVLSSLFAHIMMLLQSSAVIDVFRGRDSGWKPQRRDDGSLPIWEIMQFHSVHMTLGICLAALTFYSSTILFLWMLPASLGLVFSGPLSAWSAQRSAGEAFRRLGLLQIEEEKAPPPIASEAAEAQERLEKAAQEQEAITQLVRSPKLRRLHRELIQMQPITLELRISPKSRHRTREIGSFRKFDRIVEFIKAGRKGRTAFRPGKPCTPGSFHPCRNSARNGAPIIGSGFGANVLAPTN